MPVELVVDSKQFDVVFGCGGCQGQSQRMFGAVKQNGCWLGRAGTYLATKRIAGIGLDQFDGQMAQPLAARLRAYRIGLDIN